MRFRTTLLSAGKTATGLHIPDEIIAGLGSSRKPAVKVTINGYTYRSTPATRRTTAAIAPCSSSPAFHDCASASGTTSGGLVGGCVGAYK